MLTANTVRDALTSVLDPELGYSIVELGLVYDIHVAENGDVVMTYTLTSPACPMAETIQKDMRAAVTVLESVGTITATLTFNPPWGPEKASDELKREFALMGILPAS